MPSFYEVMIERNFSSAHQLRGYKGKCENLHGHNYKIEVYARGEELNNIGLLIDFGDLKAAADEVVKYLDHRNINDPGAKWKKKSLRPFTNFPGICQIRNVQDLQLGRLANERVVPA